MQSSCLGTCLACSVSVRFCPAHHDTNRSAGSSTTEATPLGRRGWPRTNRQLLLSDHGVSAKDVLHKVMGNHVHRGPLAPSSLDAANGVVYPRSSGPRADEPTHRVDAPGSCVSHHLKGPLKSNEALPSKRSARALGSRRHVCPPAHNQLSSLRRAILEIEAMKR